MKRRGIAKELGLGIFALALYSGVWAVMEFIGTQLQAIKVSMWATGIFDPSIYTFMSTLFLWSPLIVLFGVMLYWLNAGNKRSEGEP